ncbi:MAG: inositol monophosphatase [Gammaproteobacteria bacterium]|nr:inositol monophosphatase [Gammaproteobacteria bacterium]
MQRPDPDHVSELIRQACQAIGLADYGRPTTSIKRDGSVVTEVDQQLQERIRGALAARWPEFAFLGEEMSTAEQAAALGADCAGVWVLDPLDGTSNFISGLPFFSVSLALLIDGRPVLGLVYDPVRDELFSAVAGGGARVNGQPLVAGNTRTELRRCIACVDFKRLPSPLAERLAHDFPYMSQRSLGSCALDWCWLALGRFQVYLHGGEKLWDYAAGLLILEEAGGFATTLDGDPVFSGSLKKRSVVAANGEPLFSSWKAWIDAHRS